MSVTYRVDISVDKWRDRFVMDLLDTGVAVAVRVVLFRTANGCGGRVLIDSSFQTNPP